MYVYIYKGCKLDQRDARALNCNNAPQQLAQNTRSLSIMTDR